MQITALGHSCVLLDFEPDTPAARTRILVDPWLSDHATGDGMGRFPRVRFEPEVLAPIHAVFLSHAHSDHLDPYTLVRLWQTLNPAPTLFLPVTLAYLAPVFIEHLPNCDVRVLHAHQPVSFRGVELMGFFDINLSPTNEDDVMVLVVRNETEVALVEADANLALHDPELRAYVSGLMAAPGMESAVFLTTENELTGTLLSKDCRTSDDRHELAAMAMNELLDSVQELYEPIDDPQDLWQCSHLIRLVHGQGLTAPHELDARWQTILFPVRIDHRVREERAAAARAGCTHRIDRLTNGAVHTVHGGHLRSVDSLSGLALLDVESSRAFDPDTAFFPELPCSPLRTERRDPAHQSARILQLLNHRFLPWLHGSRQPPFLHLLDGYGGVYRVRVHFGSTLEDGACDYVLRFTMPRFIQEDAVADEDAPPPQETYWANDLEDFLDGRCDEFSTFCRTQFPEQEIRLQMCLATPLLNSDLVEKRVRLHFARAAAGETPGTWVLPLYGERSTGA